MRWLASMKAALALVVSCATLGAASALAQTDRCEAAKILFEHVAKTQGALRPWVVIEDIDPSAVERWLRLMEDLALQEPVDPGGEKEEPLVEWYDLSSEDLPVAAEPPSESAVQALRAARLLNATTCEAVRQQATERGVRVRSRPPRDLRKDKDGLYPATFVQITLPVMTAAGAEALAYVSSVGGPLAGGGGLVLLRRQPNGSWKVTAFKPLWIS